MSKDLGDFWKPDKATSDALKKRNKAKRVKRRKRKLSRMTKAQRRRAKKKRAKAICYLPSWIFYKTKAWQEFRRKVFAAYPRVCMKCEDSESIMHVDHIKPRSIYPALSLNFSNMQVLCEDCNVEKSNLHETDYREEAAARELDRELLKDWRLICPEYTDSY